MDFAIPADDRVKLKEREKREKYLDSLQNKSTKEYEGDGDTDCNWYTRNNPQRTV